MRIFLMLVVFTFWLNNSAQACSNPGAEDHHYPSCTIPLPSDDEHVVLIDGGWRAGLSTHHIGDVQSQTSLINVNIDENGEQNYIVLNALEQTIWQFSGDIDSISRIIVLGAYKIGADGAGIIGVPADRITFTRPDLTALDSVQRTTCTRISNACMPAQWFGREPDDRVNFHPVPEQPRQRVDVILHPNIGWDNYLDGPVTVVKSDNPRMLVSIDPASVVSPNPAQPYEILPGRLGLEALVASSALIPVDEDHPNSVVANYAEMFSAQYRSRFDPDFLFTPHVDYIVTRKITLPPESPVIALMIPSGVPAPEMNENHSRRVCLYFQDQAGKPESPWYSGSPNCRHQILSQAVPDESRNSLYGSWFLDSSNVGSEGCQIYSLPADTHIAVIALSEGENKRRRNDPFRQIEIEVTRSGPTALYLSMDGGPVDWNVTGRDVIAIYARNTASLGYTQVMLNGHFFEYTQLGNSKENCPESGPFSPIHLGPAIKHLDEMFDTLTGHRIDQLITYTDTGEAWREEGASVATYVVE